VTLQLTARGAVADLAAADALAREFTTARCVVLPSLLSPVLLSRTQHDIDTATFSERLHADIASELCMAPNATLGMLHFLVNDPQVFRFVERVTGVTGLCGFYGRVYRRLPDTDHHDSWHTDVLPDRAVGMSVNLSRNRYDGGVFEIRDDDEEKTVRGAVANVGFGDAILFAIAAGLEHRVTNVTGREPKTAFAGWFSQARNYLESFKEGRS